MFPDASGDLASENFEPNWFLLEHHHATSFDDLKVGLAYLKRKVEGQKEGQLSFLKVKFKNSAVKYFKDHAECFTTCYAIYIFRIMLAL